MREQIEMLKEFHNTFSHPIDLDSGFNKDNLLLREGLCREEFAEFDDEIFTLMTSLILDDSRKISTNLLKEGADLLYVLLGTFVSLGLGDQLTEAFKRVHESNMSKLGEDGKPVFRYDGKVMKGPNYKPPNLGDLI